MKTDLNKNGLIILRKVFTKTEIFKIKNEILKTSKKKLRKRDINLVNNKINTFHALKKNKKILKFAQNNIIPIADKILKKKTKVKGIEYFAKPARIGMPSPPHQDNFYWCLKKPTGLNFWIAIDNASKKNGGVYYYLGSQKLGLRKHINSGIAGSSQMIKNLPPKKYKKFYPNLKIGDLMFHHLQVIHGSGANSTNTSRKGLVVNVIAKDSKIDKIKRNAYLKNLNLQIKQRGKEHARI